MNSRSRLSHGDWAGVGAGGVLLYMVGELLAKGGLQPFLPFSRWKIKISPLAYDNRVANTGLFVLGILAIVGGLLPFFLVPALVLVHAPVELTVGGSPVWIRLPSSKGAQSVEQHTSDLSTRVAGE